MGSSHCLCVRLTKTAIVFGGLTKDDYLCLCGLTKTASGKLTVFGGLTKTASGKFVFLKMIVFVWADQDSKWEVDCLCMG